MKRKYKAKRRIRKPELGTYIRLHSFMRDVSVDGTVVEHLSTQFVIDVVCVGTRVVHMNDNWEVVV